MYTPLTHVCFSLKEFYEGLARDSFQFVDSGHNRESIAFGKWFFAILIIDYASVNSALTDFLWTDTPRNRSPFSFPLVTFLLSCRSLLLGLRQSMGPTDRWDRPPEGSLSNLKCDWKWPLQSSYWPLPMRIFVKTLWSKLLQFSAVINLYLLSPPVGLRIHSISTLKCLHVVWLYMCSVCECTYIHVVWFWIAVGVLQFLQLLKNWRGKKRRNQWERLSVCV